MLEHLVNGALNRIELLVDLNENSRHEEHRWVVRNNRDSLSSPTVNGVKTSLTESCRGIAKRTHEP